jgi:hypothetical protein
MLRCTSGLSGILQRCRRRLAWSQWWIASRLDLRKYWKLRHQQYNQDLVIIVIIINNNNLGRRKENLSEFQIGIGHSFVGHLRPVWFMRMGRSTWSIMGRLVTADEHPGILVGMSGYGATGVMGGAEALSVDHLKGTRRLLVKRRSLDTPLMAARALTWSITDCGARSSSKVWRLITDPVTRLRKWYLPWKLPVGPRQVAGSVQECNELVGVSSSCVLQYAPNRAWQWHL